MKKCVPAASGRVCALLVIAVSGAGAGFFLRKLLAGEQPRLALLGLGVFLGGTALRLLWALVSKGNWGFFYDNERVVFVLSRKDRREYRWEELPEAGITFLDPASPRAWGYFFFPVAGKGRQMAVAPGMTGREEFLATVREKGVPAPGAIPLGTKEPDVEEIFRTVFDGEFGGKK